MPCVARTRLHTPPRNAARRDLDPVVTREPGALRRESLGACCGVRARFDVAPHGLDAETITVDVDFDTRMGAGRPVTA
jgi:hypothetical protein